MKRATDCDSRNIAAGEEVVAASLDGGGFRIQTEVKEGERGLLLNLLLLSRLKIAQAFEKKIERCMLMPLHVIKVGYFDTNTR